MKKQNIFLMRHGKTKWNIEGKLQGRKNSPLLDSSKSTANLIAQYLVNQNLVNKVYSSPLLRCVETAQIVCDILGIAFEIRDELMECDMGECEGLTWQEAKEQFPIFFTERECNKWITTWPNGESYQDVFIRAKGFLQELPYNENILLIGHEMFNKCFIGAYLNWTPDQIIAFYQANNELKIIIPETNQIESIQFK
jgi:broad specificity phosphatase PhoE